MDLLEDFLLLLFGGFEVFEEHVLGLSETLYLSVGLVLERGESLFELFLSGLHGGLLGFELVDHFLGSLL